MQLSQFLAQYQPINVVEAGKVERIAQSLISDGWQGAPIVVDGGALVTGSHRMEALRAAVDVLGYDFDVPTIELAELFEEAGLDLTEAMEEECCEGPWECGYGYVLAALPEECIERYGIQW